MSHHRAPAACLLFIAFVGTLSAAPPTDPVSTVFVQGLHNPVKVIVTPGHHLLVSEAGRTGRLEDRRAATAHFRPDDGD
jgi:hypothetical protein